MRAFNALHIPRPDLPAERRALFERPNLDLEIGAGQGLHAIQYCSAHPDRTLIAIERTHTRFAQLVRRLNAHPTLTNLVPIQADAVSLVTHYLRDESLGRIYLLYPNPYPKAKQANLRWHNRPFMSELIRKLAPNGKLILATNIPSYADQARETLVDTWRLTLAEDRPIGAGEPPRTHFEKKYLARGEPCRNLVFWK